MVGNDMSRDDETAAREAMGGRDNTDHCGGGSVLSGLIGGVVAFFAGYRYNDDINALFARWAFVFGIVVLVTLAFFILPSPSK